ncbi:uncharacterized protein LOC111379261 isoform X1 [Olea europaea var. sylvestris]|uniref:uncharacterized protein LOC111379261 isoform X1 n=1 Tax=Olea europaea var. sylvestris TaxID=158386 RepID=UPI000C1D429C|nr:uncharacterized protein LOC111379261 isoform X1 [Olea europaea var. sylvestris]XP_022858385.1 uncharacterized protein LOC111379261 isoform X1 [Olea europaea var. sylvestris]
MSSQNPASSHGSRTYWTPTMERYFIDLMLEHIHRGNRTGHTFNKQAWTDMLAVFNAKFGSQYDKDVLKSRYTNLWKQFNDIKNILGQSGFSWDETRQMVVADDYLWDAYIKIHPEARPYKTKAILNFDDLCLIYGYTVADGRYSRSSHDMDVEDENLQGAILGNGNNGIAPSSSSRTEWTPDMDDYFIKLMLTQQESGNKHDNTFTKQAWTDMLVLFNAKFGADYSKRVLRHRYKKLWKYYCDLTTLVKQKGFCWDEKEQMVIADDDVWDAYIKAHPHALSFRNKNFPNYNNLRLIIGDIIGEESQSNSHQDKGTRNKAVAANAGSVRSRTYWTPPMDLFFIDLMLEQVRKGNRIGQSFITQAWNDMVASFNEKFRSQHDKEILKNRYKHFKKQYNDVKILLQHSGFSWDDGREMVTAEDCVWDAYLKAHPDARSYRVKAVPCYHKLCVIYGHDKLEGGYNSLADSIAPTTETPVGDGKDEDSSSSIDAIEGWTMSMERYLIDLMLEQVHQGNKVGGTFSEQALAHMTLTFKEKFGVQYEQHILENRCHSLMKQYNEISNLLNQNGFAWNETLQMIVADNDVWESYRKENPGSISYKDKIQPQYNDLGIIFGPTETVEGELSYEDVKIEFDQDPTNASTDKYSGDLPTTVLDSETSDQATKRPTEALTVFERCSKVPKIGKEEIKGPVTNITGVVEKLVNKEAGKNYSAIESAIEALQEIPDIDDELLLDGCDLLEDERKAKTFLALDVNLRKKWLLRKLRRS